MLNEKLRTYPLRSNVHGMIKLPTESLDAAAMTSSRQSAKKPTAIHRDEK
jgi:hypothetical protein